MRCLGVPDVNAIDYLLKPFDRDRVLQAVEGVRGCGCRRSGKVGKPRLAPTDLRVDTLLKLIEQHQVRCGRTAGRLCCRREAGCCWWIKRIFVSRRSTTG